MALMDRIYCEDFIAKSYPNQLAIIENVRMLRSSAIANAKIAPTKSARKNATKRKRKPKDITKAATTALKKLSPAQIALIKQQFQA